MKSENLSVTNLLDELIKEVINLTMVKIRELSSKEEQNNNSNGLNQPEENHNNTNDDICTIFSFVKEQLSSNRDGEVVDFYAQLNHIQSKTNSEFAPKEVSDLKFIKGLMFDLGDFILTKNVKEVLNSRCDLEQAKSNFCFLLDIMYNTIRGSFLSAYGRDLPFTDIGKKGLIVDVSNNSLNKAQLDRHNRYSVPDLVSIDQGFMDALTDEKLYQNVHNHSQFRGGFGSQEHPPYGGFCYRSNPYNGNLKERSTMAYINFQQELQKPKPIVGNEMITIPVPVGSLINLEVKSVSDTDYYINIPKSCLYKVTIRKVNK